MSPQAATRCSRKLNAEKNNHYKKTVNYMEFFLRISMKILQENKFHANFHTNPRCNLQFSCSETIMKFKVHKGYEEAYFHGHPRVQQHEQNEHGEYLSNASLEP